MPRLSAKIKVKSSLGFEIGFEDEGEMEHLVLVDQQSRQRPDGDHHYYIWEMWRHRAAFNLCHKLQSVDILGLLTAAVWLAAPIVRCRSSSPLFLAQAQRPLARNQPLGLLRLAPLQNPPIREAYYSYDNGTTQCMA